ncbi:MAG TPA: replicative DNA helicase [Pirellulales bacterium]|nr:replicative DNA helicase [Pirellulales bacterium]
MAAFQRLDERPAGQAAAVPRAGGPQAAVPKAAPRATAELFDRLPPQNLDAEKGVLGSMILTPDVGDEVALRLRECDFYLPHHQVLYRHLLGMQNEGVRIDATLLHERLKHAGDVETVGGVAYLAEVIESVSTAAHAVYYAQIVREKAVLRSLIHASTEILRDAYDPTIDSRDMLNRAEEKLLYLLEEDGASELAPLQDVLAEALSRIDARLEKGGGVGGMPTGFTDLDRLTGGLHEGELVIIAGRPSMGKTALATNIADQVAIVGGRTTLFVSLEMSRLELAERLLCGHGRINGHRLRNGLISSADRSKLIPTSNTMSTAPLYIDDSPSRTMTEIAATGRRLKRKHELGLVIIDYLQLIEPDNPRDPRQEQVAKIARRLKSLARELKVPVICLAQLNRQAEVAKDNRPRLSHLRESGAIEQDADVVLFVHRDEYYQTNDEDRERVKGQAEIIIAKQRNGPTDEVKVAWLPDYTRFENLAREAEYDFSNQF